MFILLYQKKSKEKERNEETEGEKERIPHKLVRHFPQRRKGYLAGNLVIFNGHVQSKSLEQEQPRNRRFFKRKKEEARQYFLANWATEV